MTRRIISFPVYVKASSFGLPPTTAEMIALKSSSISIGIPQRSERAHLRPSLRFDVTESPTMLVSILSLLTISPAPLSANSGSCLSVDKYASFLMQDVSVHEAATRQSETYLTLAMILCPLNRIRIARPAFAAAPTQKVNASTAAATGNESPKNVSWVGEAKKSMSLPMVRGTSMDTPLETKSCDARVLLEMERSKLLGANIPDRSPSSTASSRVSPDPPIS
jgi:hypothetical protein